MTTLFLDLHARLSQFDLALKAELSLDGIIGIFGHSGAGKSTLLKAIAGQKTPVSGNISIDDDQLLNTETGINTPCHQRRIVGVFQQDLLFEHLNVSDNIHYGRKRIANPHLDSHAVIQSAGIAPLLDLPIKSLSGGERQKVALVQAILAEPRLLILDEPVSALDRINKRQIYAMIRELQQLTKVPILYVSHDIHEIQALCHYIYVLEQGKIKSHGEIHSVVHQLNHSELIEKQTSLKLKPINESNDDQHGLCQFALPSGDILIGVSHAMTSGASQAYILASDISICTITPENSSIVNLLQGVISQIECQDNQALVEINCNGQAFFSTISTYSLDKLSLVAGQSVYLQFKASAIKPLN